MSQEVSTSPRLNPLPIEHLPSAPPAHNSQTQPQGWSANTDAEQLMDEVFLDLDRILAGGANLVEVPEPEQTIALQTLVVPPISLPPSFLPEPQPAPVLPETTTTAKPQPENYLDRILLGIALAVVGASGVLWLVSKDILKLPFLPPAPTPVASQPVNPVDAKFIDYVERSLKAIDRRASNNSVALQSGDRLPSPNGGVPLPPTQAPPTVLERVYIPVFPPQMANPALPIAPGLLTPRPTAQSPSPAARSSNPPAQSAPERSAAREEPARTGERAPERAPARTTEETEAPRESPAQTAAAPGRTLTGVLELGDSSAALFEIDGVTQRVAVGEGIGDSGWTLVKVENQQAVIRRNGVVQSLYVGGRF
ncbi:MAG: hypothetical protein HC916_19030 [Coleofasciculaceae cyanobacterium SM2_1_6]|nr:hypothetical protein [Coleofasciculaceae cyanobacterium SM2_1_6]